MRGNCLLFCLTALSFSILTFSCSPSREKQINRISDLEKKVIQNGTVNPKIADALITSYHLFVKKFSQDSLAPEMLYKEASLQVSLNRAEEGLATYARIGQEYPSSARAPEALFMQAFTCDNVLKDIARAGKFYTMFLQKYPDHKLAHDAEIMLKYLGKPEEILKDIGSGNQPDSLPDKN